MKRRKKQFAFFRLSKCALLLPLLCVLTRAASGLAQSTTDIVYTTLQSAPSGAFEVKLSDGQCRFLSYRIAAPFPTNSVIERIAAQLQKQRWTRLHFAMFNQAELPVPEKWKHWTNVMGGRVHTMEEQWQSPEGAVIYYKFWYFSPDLKTLLVDARHCSAEQLEHTTHHVDCENVAPASGDDPAFSAVIRISKIEPAKDGYKIYFRVENSGSKPFLLPFDWKREDGSPHLRAYPEQQQDGSWSSVDNECLACTPITWIDVKPGASVESWVSAVDFPEPNKRFGMCTRRIGHLQGPLRVSLRYFIGTCDIQDVFAAKKPYFASSEPVEPTSPQL
jgi:hypothetical protein